MVRLITDGLHSGGDGWIDPWKNPEAGLAGKGEMGTAVELRAGDVTGTTCENHVSHGTLKCLLGRRVLTGYSG